MEKTWWQLRAINLAGHKEGWLSWDPDTNMTTPYRYDTREEANEALATFINLAPGWSGRVVRLDQTITEED